MVERGTEEEKEAASVGAFSELLIDVANEPAVSPDISHRHAQTLCTTCVWTSPELMEMSHSLSLLVPVMVIWSLVGTLECLQLPNGFPCPL